MCDLETRRAGFEPNIFHPYGYITLLLKKTVLVVCVCVRLLQWRKVPLPFTGLLLSEYSLGFRHVAAARKAQGGFLSGVALSTEVEWPSPRLGSVS